MQQVLQVVPFVQSSWVVAGAGALDFWCAAGRTQARQGSPCPCPGKRWTWHAASRQQPSRQSSLRASHLIGELNEQLRLLLGPPPILSPVLSKLVALGAAAVGLWRGCQGC